MILLLAFATALGLHVVLGWQWSIIGGFIAGIGTRRFGWAMGTAAVGLSWATLVIYNFAVAPTEMGRFVEITSRLLGNMDGATLVVTTILLGAVLGLLGGAIGSILRSLIDLIRGGPSDAGDEPAEPNPEISNIEPT